MRPFKRGMEAFRSNDPGNPYNEGTQRAKDWELGYNRAYYDNLARVLKRESNQSKTRG